MLSAPSQIPAFLSSKSGRRMVVRSELFTETCCCPSTAYQLKNPFQVPRANLRTNLGFQTHLRFQGQTLNLVRTRGAQTPPSMSFLRGGNRGVFTKKRPMADHLEVPQGRDKPCLMFLRKPVLGLYPVLWQAPFPRALPGPIL